MVKSVTHIRVRYAEVDQMGFLHHGNYAAYYEVGRGEMIREAGYPYSEMEKDGIVMPVVKMSAKFLRPALYEDNIRVETTMKELLDIPFVTFHHKLFNEKNELIHTSEITLTFFDPKIQKRVAMPKRLRDILEKDFK
jgi:acyl-CoA thioester hydrolase